MIRNQLYAQVAFALPLPRPSHYLVPPEMEGEVSPGRLVLAPLAKREEIGCVVDVREEPPSDVATLRPLIRRVSPDFEIDAPLIDLARWIADYYLCGLGEALAAVSFIGFSDLELRRDRWISLQAHWKRAGGGGEAEERLVRGAVARRRILGVLREGTESEMNSRDLLGLARASRAALDALIEAGALSVREAPVPWRVRGTPVSPSTPPLLLTEHQQVAFDPIVRCLEERRFGAFLLQGVTGSGKTEVYLQAIQRCLDQGRQAICLVPEIALTPQTIARFQARFGARIGVCHGGMSRPEKLRLAHGLRTREFPIVVGPRSAVFSPVPDLGLFVVDEEHEGTYKQDETPRYHARDVGLVRARAANAVVILGTATPCLESLTNARQGKYTLLTLPERIDHRPLPPVELVDMAAELREAHNPTLFSGRLEQLMRDRLSRREQVILLLNRRGFANFVLCPNCGHLPRCPNDDTALTYHVLKGEKAEEIARAADEEESQLDLFQGLWSQDPELLRKAHGRPKRGERPDTATPRPVRRSSSTRVGPTYLEQNVQEAPPEEGRVVRLVCHFCGRKIPMPPRCPQCADPRLSVVGQGTQRIEEELAERFPDARMIRMDSDAMTTRDSYDDAWRRITQGEIDVILGTQMIAKGLHLERVTLVGVVLADVGLFVPDFRASERTFSLLTQVAGRTGRGERGGEVVVQTYVPQNAAIQCALTHDIEKFAEHEMKRRRWLRFPPVTRLASLTMAGKRLDAVLEATGKLTGILRRLQHREEHKGCSVLGPMPAPLGRLRGRWRQRLLVRGDTSGPLHALLRASLYEYHSRPHPGSVRLTIDVDPLDMM